MSSDEIKQLLPAPGWKAFMCFIDADNVAFFEEVPVIGWGIVRKTHHDTVQGNIREDEIKLFVFDEYVRPIDDDLSSNSKIFELAPGTDLGQEVKAQMEQTTRLYIGYKTKGTNAA
jgi:hypothetical protein